MLNLFDTEVYTDIVTRLNKIESETKPLWGKMTAAQMFAHCKEAFKVPLSDVKMPRATIGILLGWMFKSKLYNDSPWKKNLPTAPILKIKTEKDFYMEKLQLAELISKFYTNGPDKTGKFPHPVFGRFTSEQWGKSMYKHLDHHLKQFGV